MRTRTDWLLFTVALTGFKTVTSADVTFGAWVCAGGGVGVAAVPPPLGVGVGVAAVPPPTAGREDSSGGVVPSVICTISPRIYPSVLESTNIWYQVYPSLPFTWLLMEITLSFSALAMASLFLSGERLIFAVVVTLAALSAWLTMAKGSWNSTRNRTIARVKSPLCTMPPADIFHFRVSFVLFIHSSFLRKGSPDQFSPRMNRLWPSSRSSFLPYTCMFFALRNISLCFSSSIW